MPRRANEDALPLTETFQAALGYQFSNLALLKEALTHASVGMVRRSDKDSYVNYERLEFLGDRVLGLVVADLLLQQFPEEVEGAIAKRYAALVSREFLVRVAQEIDLQSNLIYAKNDRSEEGNTGILADALEAVIAALYRDGGLVCAAAFIERHWATAVSSTDSPPRDPKSHLQEWVMAKGLPLPHYIEVAREGPPHEPTFTIAVKISGYPEARGQGPSKRISEQRAAAALWEIIEASGE